MKVFTYHYESHENLISYIKQEQLLDLPNMLILYFSGILDLESNQEIITLLNHFFPSSTLVGSSTAGEIHNNNVTQNSLVLSFIIMETTHAVTKILPLQEKDQIEIGRFLGQTAHLVNAKLTLLFSDGIHTRGDDIVQGFSETAPDIFLGGGKSGDNNLFQQTYIFSNKGVHTDSIIALFLVGEGLHIKTHHRLGWTSTGPVFKVSQGTGQCVKMLDNSTVVDIYRKYLGKSNFFAPHTNLLSAFPLLYKENGLTIARSAFIQNPDGGFEFAGAINKDTNVQLGIGDVNTILEQDLALTQEITQNAPEVVFLFPCTGRKIFLGSLAPYEFSCFPDTFPTIGFYTYGEFYFDEKYAKHYFLNASLTAITLSENPTHTQEIYNPCLSNPILTLNTQFPFLNASNAIFRLIEILSAQIKEQNTIDDFYLQSLSSKQQLISSESRFNIMNEMLMMIAHQWRQPLMKANMITSSLLFKSELGLLEPSQLHQDVELLNRQLQDLSEVITKITEWFQYDKTTTNSSWNEIANCIQELVHFKILDANINFKIDIQQEVQLYTYKNDILKVLLLLINNSIENILIKNILKGNIHLALGFNLKSNNAYITLQDDGGGIPEENLNRIFEPYFSTKEEQHGAGLGLFIVKTIVEKHLAGNISISNTAEGIYAHIEFVSRLMSSNHIP